MPIIFLPRRVVQVVGCLYGGYWLLFFGVVAFLIINSYLREDKHHPAVKTASTEFHPSKRATPGSTYR